MKREGALAGQRWLVTGASRGIGRALALELARRGADLVLVARDTEALEKVVAEARAAGGEATLRPCDLADAKARSELVAEQLALPPLCGLVNNAGFSRHGPFAELDPDVLRTMIDVNMIAPMLLARDLLPPMVEAGRGRLLDVASVAGFLAVPDEAIYAATKAFILSHDRSLATELAGTGVSVTCLAPGVTETEFFATADFSLDEYELPGVPVGRAEDVARIAIEATLKGRPRVVPGARNRMLGFFLRHAPRSWARAFTRRAMRKTNAGAES